MYVCIYKLQQRLPGAIGGAGREPHLRTEHADNTYVYGCTFVLEKNRPIYRSICLSIFICVHLSINQYTCTIYIYIYVS